MGETWARQVWENQPHLGCLKHWNILPNSLWTTHPPKKFFLSFENTYDLQKYSSTIYTFRKSENCGNPKNNNKNMSIMKKYFFLILFQYQYLGGCLAIWGFFHMWMVLVLFTPNTKHPRMHCTLLVNLKLQIRDTCTHKVWFALLCRCEELHWNPIVPPHPIYP